MGTFALVIKRNGEYLTHYATWSPFLHNARIYIDKNAAQSVAAQYNASVIRIYMREDQ